MSNGPIECIGEDPSHLVPSSEYGGADGLIQPPPHSMTASEANAAITRAAVRPSVSAEESIVDPETGRVVDPGLLG